MWYLHANSRFHRWWTAVSIGAWTRHLLLKAQVQQHSLSLGDTVSSPLVHLNGQLLNNSTFICSNASTEPSFTSVTYSPRCTTFATLLVLDSLILLCMIYFNHNSTWPGHKLNHFRNTSTPSPFGRLINHFVFALHQQLQCFPKFSHTLYICLTVLCYHLPSVIGYLTLTSEVHSGHINVTGLCNYIMFNDIYRVFTQSLIKFKC